MSGPQTEDRGIADPLALDEPLVETPLGRRARLRSWAALRRSILIRLGIAVIVITGSVLLNPAFIGWGTAVTAAIIAVPVSRFRVYAAAFLPYGAVWLIFTLLRSYADETPIGLRTEQVTSVERWLFFGTTPTIWLQGHLFDPVHLGWLDYLTTFVHWSYFFVPHVAAIFIWKRSPALYRRYLLTMTITLGVGLLIYYLSPAAPPWKTADQAPQEDIYRVMAVVARNINSDLYSRTPSDFGDPNAVAAMPSIHQAITFMLFLFALQGGKRLWIPALTYSLLMGFSLVYTGEHYVIDAIVGAAIASYAYFISGRWLRHIMPLMGRVNPVTSPVSTES